jgi:hypothetical protein
MTMGKTIFEWTPDSAATREIETLTSEIQAHVEEELHSSPAAKAAQA